MIANKTAKYCLLTGFLTLPFSAFPQTNDSSSSKEKTLVAAAETAQSYIIDQDHSKVTFEVAHLVISTVTGEFKSFKGTFKFNPKNFSQTQLKATADVASIDTGVKKRDDHLKSPDFFDVNKYSTMTFDSTSAKETSENTFDLTGNLTIRGITKPATFKVNYKGQIKTQNKMIQAFKGTAEINRKDFGVNFQNIVEAGPVVGDTITINITCEGGRKI